MISREIVKDRIDDAGAEFQLAWDALVSIKARSVASDGEGLFELQAHLADGLYDLADLYHDLAAERNEYVRRKQELNHDWFVNRMRLIKEYQAALRTGVSIGKAIGDAFAWFFYHNDRNMLLEHGRQPAISVPPAGAGGKGELALARRPPVIDGHFLIHHGLTNLLRLGDISVISFPDFKLAAIAEVKTVSADERSIRMKLVFTGIDPGLLDEFLEATPSKVRENRLPSIEIPHDVEARLERQIKKIEESLSSTKADRVEAVNSSSDWADLEKVFADGKYVAASIHRLGESQAIIRADLRHKRLSDRVFNGPDPSTFDRIDNLVPIIEATTVPDESLNYAYVSTPYNPTDEYRTNPSTVPMFWWPIDSTIPQRLVFHETLLFSIFNVGPFLYALEKLGFEVRIDGHNYQARMKLNDHMIEFHNLYYFFDLITHGLMSVESVVAIITRVLEVHEGEDVPLDARIEMAIHQRVFR